MVIWEMKRTLPPSARVIPRIPSARPSAAATAVVAATGVLDDKPVGATAEVKVAALANPAPAVATLSPSDYDGRASLYIVANLWWGANGTSWELFQNGVKIY